MNNNNGQGGFLPGFLIGLIIGGGAIFLLGTERGKKLLKKITEEGLDNFGEIKDLIEDEVEEYQNEQEADSKPKNTTSEEVVEHKTNGHTVAPSVVHKVSDSPQTEVKTIGSHARRLFKNIRKKN